MEGPSCAPEFGGSSWDGGPEGHTEGLVRFYESQCKSRDKYYLLFEERHSRYLLYRGRVQSDWNTSSGSLKENLDDYSALPMSERGLA